MDNLPISITDLVILIIILLSAIFAFARGFVHGVLSIAGWVGAFFATLYGYPYLQAYARDLISIHLVADILTAFVIFVTSLILLSMITNFVSRQVRTSALNALDRALGFLFGILRGAVIICAVYLGYEYFEPSKAEQFKWLREARSITFIEIGADQIQKLLPEKFKGKITRAKNAAEKEVRKKINERIYKEMVAPKPKGTSAPSTEGYGKKERRDMNRLIEGKQ
ncbi:MAG: CvpA family protein [Rhodospirillales bacterium]|jgi:membrane protein required for colicin V production